MATKVFTETTCDKCEKVDRREGAEEGYPPVGWAEAEIAWRGEGAGWSGNSRRIEKTLCPACAEIAEKALTRQ